MGQEIHRQNCVDSIQNCTNEDSEREVLLNKQKA
jgi:hypothetical protein